MWSHLPPRRIGSALAVSALLCGGLLACDGNTTGLEDRRIGAEGGTAILADGQVKLFVPPGALSEEIWFTVTPAFSVPASELLVSGSSWEIGPPGTVFSRPVTLTIAYDPVGVPAYVGEEGLGVFRVAGSDWTLLPETSADPTDHSVSGLVTTLGRFGVRGLTVASLEISPAAAQLAPGASIYLHASPLASNGRVLSSRPVAWTSSDTTVAIVDASGFVTARSEGEITVTASSEGREATSSVTVRTPVATVEVLPASSILNVGQTIQLSASGKDAAGHVLVGREVSWESSVPGVATVDSAGRVAAVAVGSASITATIGGQRGSATVGVHSPLRVTTDGLAEGVVAQAYTQTLAAAGGNGSYSWSLSEGELPMGLLLEDSTGVIRGTPSASGTSTFSVEVRSVGQRVEKSLSIRVNPIPVATVEVLPDEVYVVPSETQQLSAVARDASGQIVEGQDVSWSSNDTDVASVTATGLVTAKEPGTAAVTATVGGRSGWAAIHVSPLLSVRDTAMPPGVVGEAYSHSLAAEGGHGGFIWSIIAGNLPSGLSLNAGSGEVSGTATTPGITSFVVQVASGDGQTASRSLSIVLHDELVVTTDVLEDGVVGDGYHQILTAAGGDGPYFWSLGADTLPTGLTLSGPTGVISGIPLFEGTVEFAVEVSSQDGQRRSQPLSITVFRVPAASIELSPSTATVALGETRQLTAVVKDGSGNILTGRTIGWSSSDGSVAAVDGNGLVTAIAVGSATITGQVDDATDAATITVHAPLEVLTSSLADGVVGASYSQALAATGGDGTYSWTLTAGTLPEGLELDGSTGVISGEPLSAGMSMFVVQVSSGGQTASAVLTITIG